MTTKAQYIAKAEELLAEANEVYAELRAVPREGRTFNFDSEGFVFTLPIHQTQSERRDELGKSIRGKTAMAHVYATLAISAPEMEFKPFTLEDIGPTD